MAELLRALSVRQPWAHALIYLRKDVENRKRRHSHRGLTLIHASMTMTLDEWSEAREFIHGLGLRLPPIPVLDRGGIIGAVDVLDCVEESDSRWFFGPKGFTVADPRPVPFIPCLGTVAPLFWVPGEAVQAQARRALGLSA